MNSLAFTRSLCLILVVMLFINIISSRPNVDEAKHKKEDRLSRKRRNVWQFGILIQCAQGISHPLPLVAYNNYNNYGCHCGYGGNGDPVDFLDHCCFIHDLCYDRVTEMFNLWWWQIYLGSYEYRCSNQTITCDDTKAWKRELCNCDAVAARCFARNAETYNIEYIDHDLCQSSTTV